MPSATGADDAARPARPRWRLERQGNEVSRVPSGAPNRPAVRRRTKPRISRSGGCGAIGSIYGIGEAFAPSAARRGWMRAAADRSRGMLDCTAASALVLVDETAAHAIECLHAATGLGPAAIHGMRRERKACQFGATRTSIRSAVWPAPRVSTG